MEEGGQGEQKNTGEKASDQYVTGDQKPTGLDRGAHALRRMQTSELVGADRGENQCLQHRKEHAGIDGGTKAG